MGSLEATWYVHCESLEGGIADSFSRVHLTDESFFQETPVGLPWWCVVKNLPANAGDRGLIPGPGRCHMFRATQPVCHNYWVCTPESVATTEARAPGSCAPLSCWEATTVKNSSSLLQLEKAHMQQWKESAPNKKSKKAHALTFPKPILPRTVWDTLI